MSPQCAERFDSEKGGLYEPVKPDEEIQRAKAERGERLGTRAPYGYRKDEQKKLVIDDEAAAVVRRIFALCATGNGPSQIARILKQERVLCPTAYAYERYGIPHTGLDTSNPYHWTSNTTNMLENELYLGNTVDMKYSTKSCKDKRKLEHPREECLVIEGSHEPLIDRETRDIVSGCTSTRGGAPKWMSRTSTLV